MSEELVVMKRMMMNGITLVALVMSASGCCGLRCGLGIGNPPIPNFIGGPESLPLYSEPIVVPKRVRPTNPTPLPSVPLDESPTPVTPEPLIVPPALPPMESKRQEKRPLQKMPNARRNSPGVIC